MRALSRNRIVEVLVLDDRVCMGMDDFSWNREGAKNRQGNSTDLHLVLKVPTEEREMLLSQCPNSRCHFFLPFPNPAKSSDGFDLYKGQLPTWRTVIIYLSHLACSRIDRIRDGGIRECRSHPS